MSKMSQLHAELSEQAYKLGFESLDQAIESGEYEVIGTENWAELVSTKDEQEKAHEGWLKKRKEVIESLNDLLHEYVSRVDAGDKDAVNKKNIIENTIEFIEEGEI